MMRKAWAASRNGKMLPHFYLSDEPTTHDQFYKPEEVEVYGPFRVEAPPPPTDMVPMATQTVWISGRGYVDLL